MINSEHGCYPSLLIFLTMGASAQFCAMLFHCPVIWMDEAQSSNTGHSQLYYVLHSACALTPSVLNCDCPNTQPFCSLRRTDGQTDNQTVRQKCALFPWGLHWSCQSLHLLPYQWRLPPFFPAGQDPDRSAFGWVPVWLGAEHGNTRTRR